MASFFRFIGSLFAFFYTVLKAAAVFVFGTVALVLLIGLFLNSTREREALFIADGTALEVAPEGVIVEELQTISPTALLGVAGTEIQAETRLHDITRAVRAAADDERINAMVLKPDRIFGASPAALTEIGLALEDFKASGKPIYAYGDFYLQPQFYLASYADETWMNSAGFVTLQGYGVYPLYFKKALDKYNVTINTFRAGTYKSFVEPYTREDMSEDAKDANRAFLGSLWDNFTRTLGRNLGETADLDSYINEPLKGREDTGGNAARWAQNAGLVDSLDSRAKMRSAIKSRLAPEGEPQTIDYRAYLTDVPSDFLPLRDTVAVLYASGTILDGEQPAGTVGGDTLANRVRQAGENSAVKAIVLRIDSPGGSAFASEVIRQELLAAKAKGIKIVASFGGAAASGGYWIATAADKIIAQPTSITGSIGVFVVAPSFEGALADFGVTTDGVGTTPLSNAFSLTDGISELGGQILQIQVDDAYQRFLEIVADARGMSVTAVDQVAQGRVWTGEQALQNGLIDAYGDLDDAIEEAATLAGLDGYNRIIITDPPTPFERFLAQVEPYIGVKSTAKPALSVLEAAARHVKQLSVQGIYAHCLECAALTP